jgi:hypothetical protein
MEPVMVQVTQQVQMTVQVHRKEVKDLKAGKNSWLFKKYQLCTI